MDRKASWATVYGLPKSWTRLSNHHFHFPIGEAEQPLPEEGQVPLDLSPSGQACDNKLHEWRDPHHVHGAAVGRADPASGKGWSGAAAPEPYS